MYQHILKSRILNILVGIAMHAKYFSILIHGRSPLLLLSTLQYHD